MIGKSLGPYEITGKLGEGGMGEVYRATDTALKRDVAIKVLPAGFASDPERLARSQREAEVLAALNHPNIAAIYGLEGIGDSKALVMELVEGPTLADRIAEGPVAVDEALPIARQIAAALEAAHDRGIVHRDLKPANVKVRPDGTVKVLDFGLAKTIAPIAVSSPDGTHSPTITIAGMTRAGAILGTAAYMSPEQARGRALDRRADVWAFGCVLYEMLTGRRAFGGDDVTDILATVVRDEPDWGALPPLGEPLGMFLRQCLRKDPTLRLGDVREIRLALQGAFEAPALAATRSLRQPRWRERAVWLSVAVGLLGVVAWQRPSPLPEGPAAPSLFSLVLENAKSITSFALAPDGRSLVWAGVPQAGGEQVLWVRRFDDPAPRRLAGTDRAAYPFWSPDSSSIGFSADGFLKRVPAAGGPVQTICENPQRSSDGSWSRDSVIILEGPGGIYRVAADGGEAELFLGPDQSLGEIRYRAPRFLPDGQRFLYQTRSEDGAATIFVGSLDPAIRPRRVLGSALKWGRAEYVEPGILVYLDRSQLLVAQPVDPQTLEPSGPAMPISAGPVRTPRGWAAFSVSQAGTLSYLEADAPGEIPRRVIWMSRGGRDAGEIVDRLGAWTVALSPDETSIATNVESDIWIYDLGTGIPTRGTTHPSLDYNPVWSPDGQRYAFTSTRKGINQVFVIERGAAGEGRKVVAIPSRQVRVQDWSRDGDLLLLLVWGGPTANDVWTYSFANDEARPFLETKFDEEPGELSPDGRWLAYTSDEAGGRNVYIVPFPGPGAPIRVSPAGGSLPRWRGDGRELFYPAPDHAMMSVPISGDRELVLGPPTVLFRKDLNTQQDSWSVYDVTADGQRFFVVEPGMGGAISVLVGWSAKLQSTATGRRP